MSPPKTHCGWASLESGEAHRAERGRRRGAGRGGRGRTVEAPEVTPTLSGPSRSQGPVSTSSPAAVLCVIALRATSMQAAELTQ